MFKMGHVVLGLYCVVLQKNDEICKRVGLCSSTLTAQQNRVSQDACDLCKLVANFLKHYVDSNSTEDEIKAALEQLCSILPSNFSSQVSMQHFVVIYNNNLFLISVYYSGQ